MQQRRNSVDHDKVFKGLTSLRAAGIKPKWLVLDDGWQSTSNPDASNGAKTMAITTTTMNHDDDSLFCIWAVLQKNATGQGGGGGVEATDITAACCIPVGPPTT